MKYAIHICTQEVRERRNVDTHVGGICFCLTVFFIYNHQLGIRIIGRFIDPSYRFCGQFRVIGKIDLNEGKFLDHLFERIISATVVDDDHLVFRVIERKQRPYIADDRKALIKRRCDNRNARCQGRSEDDLVIGVTFFS